MTYNEKKKIADQILQSTVGVNWDDLADTNSLHDVEPDFDQDIHDALYDACNERFYQDSGFTFEALNE